jgi:hypothetical protein
LIKQRLEGVVVVPVNQGHLDWDVGQLFGYTETTKPCSDNNDV